MNTRTTHETIQRHVSAIVSAIGLAADQLTRENKHWHDDSEADDHALFHSPSDVQFPPDMRMLVAAECVLYFLRETPAGIKIADKLSLATERQVSK